MGKAETKSFVLVMLRYLSGTVWSPVEESGLM